MLRHQCIVWMLCTANQRRAGFEDGYGQAWGENGYDVILICTVYTAGEHIVHIAHQTQNVFDPNGAPITIIRVLIVRRKDVARFSSTRFLLVAFMKSTQGPNVTA